MPKVMRQVEQDVSVDELNADLAEAAKTVITDGVYFKNEDGSRGDDINTGDFLEPTAATYLAMNIVPETMVYAVKPLNEAGIVWCVFHRTDGQKAAQFFVPAAFARKYAPAPKLKAAKKAK